MILIFTRVLLKIQKILGFSKEKRSLKTLQFMEEPHIQLLSLMALSLVVLHLKEFTMFLQEATEEEPRNFNLIKTE